MMLLPLLAQVDPVPIGQPPSDWLPIVLLIVMGIGFAVTNVIASHIIGPRRQGAVKSGTYESGMVPFGDTHRRFNVRFYIVAMIFLVVDVEIVFFYPWATIFSRYARAPDPTAQAQSTLLLAEIILFVAILLVAYIYAWGKGVFRWD